MVSSMDSRTLRYQTALANWPPYKDKLESLERIEASIASSFDALQALADEPLTRSKTLLEGLERRVVGKAQVAANIYGDEVDLL